MSLILNIDTAFENATVSLALEGEILSQKKNDQVNNHASWLHKAVEDLFTNCNHNLNNLNAIAVVAGPGSYTGLRVGMAAAKGLCYTKGIPLIAVNTLELMAFAMKANYEEKSLVNDDEPLLFCPMIDARRMEVYTALYNNELNIVLAPTPLLLEDDYFDRFLEKNRVIFFGNGSHKLKTLKNKKNVSFSDYNYTTKDVALLTYKNLLSFCFTNLAYSEPFYIKDFYFHQKTR
jgi:tRNA threonylcarbamoyladenosine biosynthesis protein TsaB